MDEQAIWVILPTLNEVENLGPLVAAIRRLEPAARILAVDDASTDGTAELADRLAREDGLLSVVHRQGKRGYGEALTAGFREAVRRGARAIVTLDCDFSHDPADVPRLLAALESADVVVGSRYTPGGRILAWSLYRRLLSRAANAYVRTLFHLPAKDCTSGFRAYRREAVEGLPWERLHSTGYSFLVEVLYWAARPPGRRFREIPICFFDRRHGKSKMGLREIVFGALNLIRLQLELRSPLRTK